MNPVTEQPAGGDFSDRKKNSDWIEVYKKMALFLTYYLSKHFTNKMMMSVTSLKLSPIEYNVKFANYGFHLSNLDDKWGLF